MCISTSETYPFKEHGKYGWNLYESGGNCSNIQTFYEPWNPYLRKTLQFLFPCNIFSICIENFYPFYHSSPGCSNGLYSCTRRVVYIQVDYKYS